MAIFYFSVTETKMAVSLGVLLFTFENQTLKLQSLTNRTTGDTTHHVIRQYHPGRSPSIISMSFENRSNPADENESETCTVNKGTNNTVELEYIVFGYIGQSDISDKVFGPNITKQ